jgi:hypothetical protein
LQKTSNVRDATLRLSHLLRSIGTSAKPRLDFEM